MALSNIFREPRREITETAVGLGVLCGLPVFCFVCAEVAPWWRPRPGDFWGDFFLIPLFIFMGTAALFAIPAAAVLFAVAIHDLGESVCNALQRRGVYLRPKVRPPGVR